MNGGEEENSVEKVTFHAQVGEAEEVKIIANSALVTFCTGENELNTEIYGELDDNSLLLSGLGAFIFAVEEMKKRHPQMDEANFLEGISMKSAEILANMNYGELVKKMNNALEEENEEGKVVENPPFAGENLFANLFGFASKEEQGEEQEPSVLLKNVSLSPLIEDSDEKKLLSHLKVVTTLKKVEGQPPEIQSNLEGYGQIQDIIEIGCANYTYATNYANSKWLELLPDSNPMMVQLQTSQKAAELLMKYQLGEASGLMGQLMPDFFSSIFGNNDESGKD